MGIRKFNIPKYIGILCCNIGRLRIKETVLFATEFVFISIERAVVLIYRFGSIAIHARMQR